jgi:hypothetical protein
MHPEYKSPEAIIKQLYSTQETIKHFLDETKGDDLPRYPNIEQHLKNLIDSIHDSDDALISFQELNIQVLPNMTPLIRIIDDAITVINKSKKNDNTGTLAAALAALSSFQESISEFKQEGPKAKRQKIEKTDTDSRTR